jgi:hypothetical protein
VLSLSTTNVQAGFCFTAFGRYSVLRIIHGLNPSPDQKSGDITVISEFSGQSGGETPVPIPNTEVKPVNVLHCTKMCELSGTVESR